MHRRRGLAQRTQPVGRRRIVDPGHISHAAFGRTGVGSLLPGAGGINRHVTDRAPAGIGAPVPPQGRAEQDTVREQFLDAPPRVFRGPLDRRFRQANAGHLRQDVGTALEALDAAGQAGQALDGRGELPGGDAGALIGGTQALTAAAAVVVRAPVAEDAEQADEVAGSVGMIGGGLVTVGAGYAGPFVAVFFCARCCW